METISCNLCGSNASTPIYCLQDLLLEREQVTTQLVKCDDCSLIYQNPRPEIEEMSQHYPQEYESYATTSDDKTPWLMHKAYQYGIKKRCRSVTRYKDGGNLLDIGCAAGNFLHGMQNYPKWELFGVEINEYAAETARQVYGLNVKTGTLESASYPNNFFDAVTLWDVLEHLHDPLDSLKEIWRILKPGGILVIRVPNIDSWDAQIFGLYWAGLDTPRHLYIFSQNTLARMLIQADFKAINMNCKIGSYPTFVLSVRFWLKAKGIHPQKREQISRFLYSPFARMITVPIFWLYNLGLHGPLLTVTAQK